MKEATRNMTGMYQTNMPTTRPILYRCGICLTILFFSIYLTILNLPRGEHYYRYIVDGKGNDTNVIRLQKRPTFFSS